MYYNCYTLFIIIYSNLTGHYCELHGLAAPTAPCDAGYYCANAASTSAPTDGTTGDRCPPGAYCPQGTATPELCPPGTFSNQSGNEAEGDCTECTPSMCVFVFAGRD